MTNTIQFTPDDTRKVFAIPVALMVKSTLYILARNHHHAVQVANAIDLQDYIAFGPQALRTDDEGLLKIDDVLTHPMDVNVTDLTQLTTEEYPPNQHPDYVGIRR